MKTSNLSIGLAQLPIVKGDVAKNLVTHLEYVERAAAAGANVVVFPELSLTGYELELLEPLAMAKSAELFDALSAAAITHNSVIIAGCPLVSEGHKPQIGAVICFPSGQREFYAKQHLHDGENVYCSAGGESYLMTVNDIRIALAICADFSSPAHADAAAAQQADVYIASALISEAGYEADAELLSGIARRHQFPILLANHISPMDGWQICGKSGGWNVSGELAVAANGAEPSLMLCPITKDAVSGRITLAT